MKKDRKKAEQIQERVILVAFGQRSVPELEDTKGLQVIPLEQWSNFEKLCIDLE